MGILSTYSVTAVDFRWLVVINIWGLLLWANIVTQTQEPVLEMR